MRITNMRVNHLKNPIGYDFSRQTFSWNYEAEKASDDIEKIRIEISEYIDFKSLVYEKEIEFKPDFVRDELHLELQPRTRYYWKIILDDSKGRKIQSDISYFETGKINEAWRGKWICTDDKHTAEPLIRKAFYIEKEVKCARIYMTGLGLYEGYLNGKIINDGFLQPGFNNYNHWIQYQTYDLTDFLTRGENVISFLLGAGWYKGRFGVNGGFENNFGKHYHLLCEIHIRYEDGTEEVFGSDRSFLYTEGPVSFSNIYDGEIYDAGKEPKGWKLPGYDDALWKNVNEKEPEHMKQITERYSVPVVVKEKIRPQKLFRGNKGTLILDTGQNMSGWIVFRDTFEPGKEMQLKYAEHMQDGKIYTNNLRSARQEFRYTSDGKGGLVRPHFTYYGFRYVELEGFPNEASPDDFEVWNIYSDLDSIGRLSTGNNMVNQLISNVLWSQKSNFIELPTDCPQRAERLGWTGDAQMYAATASFNMLTLPFYRKFLKDMNEEQKTMGGMVPFIVPKIKGRNMEDMEETCSSAWSDAAVIIPWTLYLFYGDRNLLREAYPGMKAWVDYLIDKDIKNGNKNLCKSGFQFGDWLALDNEDGAPFGLTDPLYIASCYYYYSTDILRKAASVLGFMEDENVYGKRAAAIKAAVRREYFDSEGICKIDTQTGYILAIYMELLTDSEMQKNAALLEKKIKSKGGHLDTGFVGTPYICRALSKAGLSKTAYDLLLNEEYPGWLYQVKCGATTIWENWDALEKDGKMHDDASLNHYAFGSILEWLYRDACGINPVEEYPGFQKMLMRPKADKRLRRMKGNVTTPYGKYEIAWEINKLDEVNVKVEIPFSGCADIILEDGEKFVNLHAGSHKFSYKYSER